MFGSLCSCFLSIEQSLANTSLGGTVSPLRLVVLIVRGRWSRNVFVLNIATSKTVAEERDTPIFSERSKTKRSEMKGRKTKQSEAKQTKRNTAKQNLRVVFVMLIVNQCKVDLWIGIHLCNYSCLVDNYYGLFDCFVKVVVGNCCYNSLFSKMVLRRSSVKVTIFEFL